jgi:hypothetical protein
VRPGERSDEGGLSRSGQGPGCPPGPATRGVAAAAFGPAENRFRTACSRSASSPAGGWGPPASSTSTPQLTWRQTLYDDPGESAHSPLLPPLITNAPRPAPSLDSHVPR